MNKTVKTIAITISAVVVFVGVYFLYSALSDKYAPNNLVIESPQSSESEAESSHSSEAESLVAESSHSSKAEKTTESPKSSKVEKTTESPKSSKSENPAESKISAADFTVTDANGNRVKLSDMKGKPVVLNFWASWCYYCKVEMPDFEKMYKKYGDSVQFMMVDLTDDSETVEVGKAFIADSGFTFPIYFDTASEAASAYNVSGIPATYFIDAQGNLVSHAVGKLDAESLENGIKMIIK